MRASPQVGWSRVARVLMGVVLPGPGGPVGPGRADRAARVAGDVVAESGLAPGGLEQGGQDLDGRALAGAVGADEAEAVALVDLQVQVGQRHERAVALGEVYRLNHSGHRVKPLSCP